jgi:hypothetical protein
MPKFSDNLLVMTHEMVADAFEYLMPVAVR